MSWFKENKFLGLLIVITTLVGGLLLAFGIMQKGKKDELLAEADAAKADIAKKRGMDPFPNPSNVQEKKRNLKKLITDAKVMQESVLKYVPESLADTSAAAFSDLFKKTADQVRARFGDDIQFASDFYLGFERYRESAPRESATGELTYQLQAFEWLFNTLADSKIAEVDNFYRDELPVERGEEWGATEKPKGKKKPKGKRKKGARGPALPEVARRMPFQLTFSGKEENVREAITKIVNSKEYFFAIRALAFKNPGAIPSNKRLQLAKEEKQESVADAGGDGGVSLFDDEEPAEAEEPAADEGTADIGMRILEQVGGSENISVFIAGDVLLFDSEKAFPQVK